MTEKEKYKRLMQAYRVALFSTQDCIFEYNVTEGRFYAPRENWNLIFGFVPSNYPELVQKLYDLVVRENKAAFRTIFELDSVRHSALEGEERIHYTVPIKGNVQGQRFLSMTVVPVVEDEMLIRLIGCVRDLDARAKEAPIYEYSETHDEITGLLNRYHGEEEITKALDSGEGIGQSAFILIDIDNFRTINNTLGHRFGDAVLRLIARKLEALFREKAIIMRFGGDKFVVFLMNFADWESLIGQMDSLKAELNQELLHEEELLSVELTESFGVSVYPDHGTTFHKLYECADHALYQAKHKGEHGYEIFRNTTDKR